MSFLDRARASVQPLSQELRDEWLGFLVRSFGRASRQANDSWLAWAAKNPEVRDGELPVWIARREGAIVGSQASVPFRLRESGREVRAAWAIDLMVDPAWRLRGIGPALTAALTGSNALVVGLGISDAAHRAFLRSGWRDLGEMPNYVHPRDVAWSARQAGLRGAKGALAVAVARPALVLARFGSRLIARVAGVRLEAVQRFDGRMDEVWATVDYPVIAARDAKALAWRFDAAPNADRYRRHYLVQGGRVRGYVVTRLERVRDRPALVIVDYLASPRWTLALFAKVAALPEARGVAAIICQTLNPGIDAALMAAGFLRIGRTAGSRTLVPAAGIPFRFMVCQGDQPERLAFERARWFLTTGDSDIGWGRPDEGGEPAADEAPT